VIALATIFVILLLIGAFYLGYNRGYLRGYIDGKNSVYDRVRALIERKRGVH
jgi:hypothetical protein